MIDFLTYRVSTGEIISSGQTVVEADARAHESETVGLLLSPSKPAHYVSDGQLVAMGVQPSPNHIFNYTTKQWEDPRTLQDLKATQWTQIKQARSAFIDAPLVTPYGTFDSDAAGRTSITDAVLLANNLRDLSLPVAIEFTLADNSSVTLDAAQIVEVGLLLGQKVQHAHPYSQALRAQIEAATTPEQIEAVVW